MDSKQHWEGIYTSKDHTQVSWFTPHIGSSLGLMEGLNLGKDARIIDVGGGASTFVDDLLGLGFSQITVLDLSESALEIAKSRLGQKSGMVIWRAGDILEANLGVERFALWHDRAVLHFLTLPDQRKKYQEKIASSLASEGYVILSVFADDGPLKCSGIEVKRSDEADLEALLGAISRLSQRDTEDADAMLSPAKRNTGPRMPPKRMAPVSRKTLARLVAPEKRPFLLRRMGKETPRAAPRYNNPANCCGDHWDSNTLPKGVETPKNSAASKANRI
jgi:2-polyprenyl-3-methyl-5-hydroxy-6-metoxy-1,4-benzoquinol methylase